MGKQLKPHQHSVKNRIFYMNALMILAMIAVCALIGAWCIKIYWEREERTLMDAINGQVTSAQAEELVESLTVNNHNFIGMAVIFALLAVAALIVISRIFTVLLSRKVMKPLECLQEGAGRVRAGDYSNPIVYSGDVEFEQVCEAFNGMQQHLKEEQEKNARYEKARQEMIAGISHDLRSPLTVVRGSVKGILDGIVTDPEEQRKFLQTAYRRSGEMDTLLNELFYFSRLETGGIPVTVQNLDLSNYLRCYFDARKGQPDMADLEFVCDFPEKSLPPAQADPEALERILDNVITNSKKYAGVSPLRIIVALQDEDGWQKIILQDNGAGVPADRISRIFEEFYRVDESRSEKKGSGLGLYIVKYLSEAMGGRVHADQESHREGFGGLAIILELKEGASENGGEGADSDR